MKAVDLFITSISHRTDLRGGDRDLLKALPMHLRSLGKGDTVIKAHERPRECCLLARGFAGREIGLRGGGRQITAVHIPGDFVDLHSLFLARMDHSVVALTDCDAWSVGHRDLLAMVDAHPLLGRVLWLSTLIDAAMQRQWTTSMGRRTALARMAHLLAELYVRLELAGIANGRRMQLPFSQAVLADVLGLSAVHVNRTLQDLRRLSLVSWTGSDVTIHDFDGLASLADFDPTYLNIVH